MNCDLTVRVSLSWWLRPSFRVVKYLAVSHLISIETAYKIVEWLTTKAVKVKV